MPQTVQASYTCDVFGSFTQELVFDLVYDADSEIFRLDWQADDLFDGLEMDYTLRLNTLKPQRGEILDSDHNQYAINTYADTVYLRLSYYDEGDVFPLVELSSLLNMSAEELEEIIYSDRSQTDGIAILKTYPPLSIPEATENALATLEGVGVDRSTYTPIRYYPQGTTMSHAIGYVSPVTAEDMEANPGVYDVSSMVGRSGLEAVYEDTLRGEKGYSLDIYDENGSKVKNVALLPARTAWTWRSASTWTCSCAPRSCSPPHHGKRRRHRGAGPHHRPGAGHLQLSQLQPQLLRL